MNDFDNWIEITVNHVASANENDSVHVECPICGKTENIRPEKIDLDTFIGRHSAKSDVSFILCTDCYDILVDALKKAKETFDS